MNKVTSIPDVSMLSFSLKDIFRGTSKKVQSCKIHEILITSG